ncbi:hypothetical protein [Halorientalis persicus]|uniref:hypothetical protein n=1 Tax=Halorientalis persicus TaxID=1367881 RepID=UPI00147C4500|nr:hypothetical protein [Halorientalis persicus]
MTFSATNLESDDGDTISADNVSFGQSGFDIPPSSHETIEVTVDIPSSAKGDYSGEIEVSSAESSFAAPLILSVTPSLDYYRNDTGRVDTNRLREAINDWGAGDIDTTLLREVIDAWSSG